MRLFKCRKCGNVVLRINDKCDMLSCCGESMIELKANSEDAAVEKHVPVIDINGNIITLNCGEIEHPMTDDHYIEFMVIETNKGYNIKYLNPGDKPKCEFILTDDEELKSAYAYCNLHGLWINKK